MIPKSGNRFSEKIIAQRRNPELDPIGLDQALAL
jgi:hypothetical protein